MLPAAVHVLLAALMVACGACAAWLMLEMFGGVTPPERRARRARLHRWLGRTFLLLYATLLASMLVRAREMTAWGPLQALHAALGLALLPLLLVKVGIARRWKPLQPFLPLVGSLVLVAAFTTAALGVLPHLEGSAGSVELPAGGPLADHPGRRALEAHCVKCHTLARPLARARAQREDAAAWLRTVGTMRARAAQRGVPGWSDEESSQIADFLAQWGASGGAAAPGGTAAPAPGGVEPGDDRGRGRGRGGRDGR
jgi:hypothetical protein